MKKIKKQIERDFEKNFARFHEIKIILGTSDSWLTSHLSHRPSKPAYHIVDWRILDLPNIYLLLQYCFIHLKVQILVNEKLSFKKSFHRWPFEAFYIFKWKKFLKELFLHTQVLTYWPTGLLWPQRHPLASTASKGHWRRNKSMPIFHSLKWKEKSTCP